MSAPIDTCCEHRSTILIAVDPVNGAPPQYKHVCTDCGTRFSPISHTSLTDDEKREARRNADLLGSIPQEVGRRATATRATQVLRVRLSDDPRYLAYLQSPEWKDIRALVLDRSGGRCEGCAKRRARDVHHLSYAHLYDEFLFELVAVCRRCHVRWHAQSQTSPQRS